MGWKIIDIDNPCTMKSYLNNLIIFNTKRISIPISDIDVLLVSENKINMSINVINDLINNGVCLIFCNQQKLPTSYVLGYKVQKQSYINFQRQLNWDNEFKKDCWQWIVKQKIQNQIDLLEYFYSSNGEMKQYIKNEIKSLDEARAATIFFKNLYGSSFNRKKENLVNACLDYGYVIITNMVARSIVKKGLNVHISFYHGSLYSNFPLAYDIVELFRISIDLFVKTLFENNVISTNNDNFSKDIKNCLLDYIANYKIKIDDKFEFINNSIDKIIDWIINGDFRNHSINYDYDLELINDEEKTKLTEQI